MRADLDAERQHLGDQLAELAAGRTWQTTPRSCGERRQGDEEATRLTVQNVTRIIRPSTCGNARAQMACTPPDCSCEGRGAAGYLSGLFGGVWSRTDGEPYDSRHIHKGMSFMVGSDIPLGTLRKQKVTLNRPALGVSGVAGRGDCVVEVSLLKRSR
jgi:hypothetical protein